MGFGKAFGFSLLAYIGLNFLFLIIALTISGDLNLLFQDISSQPLILFVLFLGPIYFFPGLNISGIYLSISLGAPAEILILAIGSVVSPFVASIIAGKMGENKAGSFGGWFLTGILCSIILGIFAFIEPLALTYYGSIYMYGIPVIDPTSTFIISILSGAVSGVFYGAFALLFTKTEYY
ncbi:MAG: hypothetical protein WBH31_16015 [Promethearchaeia archaeon]